MKFQTATTQPSEYVCVCVCKGVMCCRHLFASHIVHNTHVTRTHTIEIDKTNTTISTTHRRKETNAKRHTTHIEQFNPLLILTLSLPLFLFGPLCNAVYAYAKHNAPNCTNNIVQRRRRLRRQSHTSTKHRNWSKCLHMYVLRSIPFCFVSTTILYSLISYQPFLSLSVDSCSYNVWKFGIIRFVSLLLCRLVTRAIFIVCNAQSMASERQTKHTTTTISRLNSTKFMLSSRYRYSALYIM